MLRIIADDLGLTPTVNDGIVLLLKTGAIDGASLMANGAAFADAVAKLRQTAIAAARIGAHLVLVEECSLTGVTLPSGYWSFCWAYLQGLLTLADIEQELRAQLTAIEEQGIKIAFINSHQHLHLLPAITDIIIRLAREYQIPYIRIVKEPVGFLGRKLWVRPQLLAVRLLSRLAKIKLKKAGLQCNDFFLGFVDAGNVRPQTVAAARRLAARRPQAVVELGCHPGFEDAALHRQYGQWGTYHWQAELETLQHYHHLHG